MDRGSQLSKDDEDDEEEEERRTRQEEAEEEKEEEATDIKSNNPHLAGGGKKFLQLSSIEFAKTFQPRLPRNIQEAFAHRIGPLMRTRYLRESFADKRLTTCASQ